MPELLDKITGNKVDTSIAAKKFRANPKFDKSWSGLDDNSLVAAVASRYPDEYEMVAPADPATPKAQIPSKLNPNRKSLEQMESENANLPISGVVLNTVGTTASNAWQGAKDLPFNAARGVANYISSGLDNVGKLISGSAPPPKDYVGLIRLSRELNAMKEDSPDYVEKFNEYMSKAKQINEPSTLDLLSDQVKQFKDKYAGPDGIVRSAKRAIVETPFETLGDVATVATGVAGAARGTAMAAGARGPSFIGPQTRLAQSVQKVTEPIAKGALAVSTYTDPVSMVPNLVRGIGGAVDNQMISKGKKPVYKPLRDAVAKNIYSMAARIPDANAKRVDKALAAGIKDSGPNFTTGKFTTGDEVGWVQKQRNKMRNLFGDSEVVDSLERFEQEAIRPKLEQYQQELQRMKDLGVTYDTKALVEDSIKDLKKDRSVHGTEMYDVVKAKVDNWAIKKGLVTTDAAGNQVWKQIDPVELAEYKADINRALKKQLDETARDYKGRPYMSEAGQRATMVLDNALRQEMVRKLNDVFGSSVIGEMSEELASMVRLKEVAEDRRFGRTGGGDKLLNLSPSELSGVIGSASWGTNWLYNIGKTGILALNKFGSPAAAKLAKYIARDPQLFTLGKAMFRGAGYQVANMADIDRIANGEAEKLRVASGVKEPVFKDEEGNVVYTAPPPAARPKIKASSIAEHPPD